MNHSKTHTSLLLAGALALLAVPAAFAGHDEAKFKANDTNSDGRVSREEHNAAGKKMFATLDTNSDGSLSAAELDASAELKNDKAMTEHITSVDQNSDGILSKTEQAAGCEAMFNKQDLNSDGYVTLEECDAGREMKKNK